MKKFLTFITGLPKRFITIDSSDKAKKISLILIIAYSVLFVPSLIMLVSGSYSRTPLVSNTFNIMHIIMFIVSIIGIVSYFFYSKSGGYNILLTIYMFLYPILIIVFIIIVLYIIMALLGIEGSEKSNKTKKTTVDNYIINLATSWQYDTRTNEIIGGFTGNTQGYFYAADNKTYIMKGALKIDGIKIAYMDGGARGTKAVYSMDGSKIGSINFNTTSNSNSETLKKIFGTEY